MQNLCFNQHNVTWGCCRSKGIKTLVYFTQCKKSTEIHFDLSGMCLEYLKPAIKNAHTSSSSYGYTTLVLHSCVWQEIHDPCSWDKLFRALSTTSGMWSVIILGLIKMLLKTVSFDHLAVYFISEEHNLKRKPNASQIQWRRLSELVLDAKPEQTTWRLWTLLREELEPSHSRKVGSQGWFWPSANSWKCCHSMSLKAELRQIVLRLNSERSYPIILLKETWNTVWAKGGEELSSAQSHG